MSMSIKEETINILERAAALVRVGWTQMAFARDAEGRICGESDDVACQWCMTGALERAIEAVPGVAPSLAQANAYGAVCTAIRRCESIPSEAAVRIPTWNDQPGRTKGEVLAVLRTAHVIAKQEC